MSDFSFSVSFTGQVAGSSTNIPLGYALTDSTDGGMVIATTAALAASPSQRVVALPRGVASAGTGVAIQQAGVMPASLMPFVGAGNATDYAVVNAAGQVVRSTDSTGAIGVCGADGSVTLDLTGGLASSSGTSIFVNVKDYGATGDGVTDDYLAIKAAIDAAGTAGGGVVYAPAGSYFTSKPFRLNGDYVHVVGDGDNSTFVFDFEGPLFTMGPTAGWAALPTAANLLTGPGVSSQWNDMPTVNDRYWLLLSECKELDFAMPGITGPTQLTIRHSLNVSSVPSDAAFFACRGKKFSSDADMTYTTQGVVTAGGVLQYILNVGGDLYILQTTGSVISLNTTYECALVYDGVTANKIWLYVNGVVQAVDVYKNGVYLGASTFATATGQVTSKRHHDFTLGCTFRQGPELDLTGSPPVCKIDTFEISKAAKYDGTDYTPTGNKFVSNSDTLFLCNFENMFDIFVVAENGIVGKQIYLPVRRGSFSSQVTGCSISKINIYARSGGSGIYAYTAIPAVLQDVTMTGVRHGVYSWNNCYTAKFVRVRATGNGYHARFGVVMCGAAGVSSIRDCQTTGFWYGAIVAAGGVVIDSFYPVGDTMAAGIYASGVGSDNMVLTLVSPFLSDEASFSSAVDAPLIIDSVQTVTVVNGCLETGQVSSGDAPSVIIVGGEKLLFTGTQFTTKATDPCIVHFEGTPTAQVVLDNTTQRGATVKWLEDTATSADVRLRPLDADGVASITLPNANYTVTANDALNRTLIFDTTALTAGRDVILGNIAGREHFVQNTGGTQTITIKASGQTGFALAAGKSCLCRHNGTDWKQMTAVI